MFKIGIDLRLLSNSAMTGMERYSLNLFQALNAYKTEAYLGVGEINDVYADFAGGINFIPYNFDLPKSNTMQANKMLALMGYLSEIDLLHSLYYPLPARRAFKGILTIHDLIPLKMPECYFNRKAFDFFDHDLRASAQDADHIIAVSEASKNDIVSIYGIAPEKITVVYPGMGAYLHPAATEAEMTAVLNKLRINDDFLLSVSTLEPRKNLRQLIKAYALSRSRLKKRFNLVLAGGRGWKYNEILDELRQSTFADDIISVGHISDHDLGILYGCALAFIYPSLMEGFGSPVLEAMACGSSVITSNCSSLPEVGGDAVVYCDPHSQESIAEAIELVVNHPELRQKLRDKGQKRARMFSWSQAAAATRQVYLNCLQ